MLPPAAVAEFQSGIDQCLQHYRWLHADAFRKKVHLWKEVPKFHFCQHIADQAALQNPRYAWTYSDEDFMGIMKRISESCLDGTMAHKVVPKVVRKWAFAVAMRLSFM